MANVITHEDGNTFVAGGLTFKFINSNYKDHKTTDKEVVVLKSADILRSYDRVFDAAPNKNFLEIGIFEGGSTLFFAVAHPEFRISALDIRDPDDAVLRHIHDLGLNERVKIHYNTSQSDKDALGKIIREDFRDEDIGFICDDASHNYGLSRRTFELTFGKLARGGQYCLEDWAWAHWKSTSSTAAALTNLVFEMVVLLPSTRPLIDSIEILPNYVRLVRGPGKIDSDISIDSMMRLRDKRLTLI